IKDVLHTPLIAFPFQNRFSSSIFCSTGEKMAGGIRKVIPEFSCRDPAQTVREMTHEPKDAAKINLGALLFG
ncbi:hypothetical protein AB6W50_27420, partial [Klebsiella pneumoniae]|uniref:hypothetical protein n=1 Tax=Klebsiella pneumoniae TaxID=573 RepID=UPI0034E1FDF6